MFLILSVPSSLDGHENETDPAHPWQFRASLPAASPAASYKHLYPAQVPGQFAPGRYAEVQLAARQKDEPPKPEGKYNSSHARPGEARKKREKQLPLDELPNRSEERRVGKECVSPLESRWRTYH